MKRFRRSAGVTAAVLVLTLIAAACSSDDDGGGDTRGDRRHGCDGLRAPS